MAACARAKPALLIDSDAIAAASMNFLIVVTLLPVLRQFQVGPISKLSIE
jgi:hypothetical protein